MSRNTGDDRGPWQVGAGIGQAAAIRRATAAWRGTRGEPDGGSR
jgi:hypothetical protein